MKSLSKRLHTSVDKDLVEVLHGFDENLEELKKLMNHRENRLHVKDLIVWMDKADDIIGEPLEGFVLFLQNTYLKKITKHSYSMKEL